MHCGLTVGVISENKPLFHHSQPMLFFLSIAGLLGLAPTFLCLAKVVLDGLHLSQTVVRSGWSTSAPPEVLLASRK